jgi:two-component system, chemotaxis family, protein-glutamate methylesterase/glutaminase
MPEERAIAIGGSAGAVSALKRILPRLPAALPAPVFVVVHVGARGRDLLADILDACGPLKVSTAQEGERPGRAHVYVAPADRHLLVIDGVIRLGRGPRENMSRPAVDALFRSVAACYGPRAVGLVLTGNLNDGAAGLAAIKRCGGLTAVQDPADADAPEMPSEALEASDVDYRAPLADLADLIAALAREPTGPERPIPRALELEVHIALGRPSHAETVAEIADVVPLSCPDCGGTLAQLKAPPLRYRCQIGHAYSANALANEQGRWLEEALGVALRIVEERAILSERMARDAEKAGRTRSVEGYVAKAAELRGSAEVLREAALRISG